MNIIIENNTTSVTDKSFVLARITEIYDNKTYRAKDINNIYSTQIIGYLNKGPIKDTEVNRCIVNDIRFCQCIIKENLEKIKQYENALERVNLKEIEDGL